MQITILKETRKYESRVAASLFSVDKFIQKGYSVVVESKAGQGANILDEDYQDKGAVIAKNISEACKNADIILKVQPPQKNELKYFSKNQTLICQFQPFSHSYEFQFLTHLGMNIFALERMPRISRAQSMDILSSQANVAGYKAVLDALNLLPRVAPMMMTAAGTIRAAKVLVMGVGVAGLQAIATAKRMGAIVSASDVRPSTKEQVESLGAKFVAVENEEFLQAQTKGGYAKKMSAEYQKEQSELIKKVIAEQDIVITTALIPNQKAPILIDEAMIKSMPRDSVIVDLAASNGGNCALSQPDEVVFRHGVHIIAYTNPASRLAQTTSDLFSKNVSNFIELFQINETGLDFNMDDEIIHQTLISAGGKTRFEEYQDLIQ